MDSHMWLIGMMGSGKSAVARATARRFGIPHVDTDAEIARIAGCSVAQLWGDRGEEAFRDMEEAVVRQLADRPPSVIATGGGVVLRESNTTAMRRSGTVVWLTAPVEVLSARVGRGRGRPLLDEGSTADRLSELLDDRRAAYEAAADFRVDVSADGVDAVVTAIEALWTRS